MAKLDASGSGPSETCNRETLFNLPGPSNFFFAADHMATFTPSPLAAPARPRFPQIHTPACHMARSPVAVIPAMLTLNDCTDMRFRNTHREPLLPCLGVVLFEKIPGR
jgi:hypothetical protein